MALHTLFRLARVQPHGECGRPLSEGRFSSAELVWFRAGKRGLRQNQSGPLVFLTFVCACCAGGHSRRGAAYRHRPSSHCPRDQPGATRDHLRTARGEHLIDAATTRGGHGNAPIRVEGGGTTTAAASRGGDAAVGVGEGAATIVIWRVGGQSRG